jgi:16S rRNA (guanine527-N7)-methyltransferase
VRLARQAVCGSEAVARRRRLCSGRAVVPEPATASGQARLSERARLMQRAGLLGVSLPESDAERLLGLLDELARWSKAYNLTSIRGREEMLTHHLLDSLAIHPDLKGTRVADVGTGAGFPGLPLAIANPARHFALIDSSGKKTRFVAHAARALALENVTAVHSRVEDLRPDAPFETIVARAFADIAELLARVRALCGPGTRVLAMKGRYPTAEIAAIRSPWRAVATRSLQIPGLEETRHVVILESDVG